MATNKTSRKRSRQKAAHEIKAIAAADQENARLRDERTAAADGMTASERAMAETAKPPRPRKKAKPDATEKARKDAIAAIDRNLDEDDAKPRKHKGAKTAGAGKAASEPKRLGILGAAVAVLKGAKEPMRCKEMVEAMLERKLWATNGRTPSATLYAAVLREIQHKGKLSRFEKVARGRFTLRKGS